MLRMTIALDWKDQLKNPPEEYRAIPFWALNDKLNDDELRWQIRQMKEAGLGGYLCMLLLA